MPNGLAFSDFKGYEAWQFVSLSQTDERLKVILANPTMIAAYKAGTPNCGHACHTAVKAKDYIFNPYQKR